MANSYSVTLANNLGLGQRGAIFEDGTTAISSKKIVSIQFIEDSTFTTLTPNDSSFIGTSGGNGDAIDTGNTFPQGMTIFGQWTGFTLATGSVIAYQGAF
jgi:hypothetical protein